MAAIANASKRLFVMEEEMAETRESQLVEVSEMTSLESQVSLSRASKMESYGY
jgi:hypothetical protein